MSSTRTAGLKDERRGSIQISGCGNKGEYLASAPVTRGLTRGTRSRREGAPVNSAGNMVSAGEWARERRWTPEAGSGAGQRGTGEAQVGQVERQETNRAEGH